MGKFLITKWNIYEQNKAKSEEISYENKVSPLVAQLLINRKITSKESIGRFLDPKLSLLFDPFLMKDMDIAAERLANAVRNKEKICVYGDFDVDGITSTAIMVKCLKWVEANANYYIPDRMNEGYGLNTKAIKKIKDEGFSLLVTVDNGTSSVEEVEYANSIGLDVIITDHHQAPDKLPPAIAVVNPQRMDCEYPHKTLAGAGISFKLAHATLRKLNIDPEKAKAFLLGLIEFVAIGTIADIVSVLDENRIIIHYGLAKLQNTSNVGISTLLQLLGLSGKPITNTSVGFYIAPRMNAAGRTNHASISVELLLTEDSLKAAEIVRYLDTLNTDRIALEDEIYSDSINDIETDEQLKNQQLIIVKGEGWHIGVLGIVASRLTEHYHKPAIVLSLEKLIAKGSARSVEGYNIFEGLKHCEELLISYGGHKKAAGLKLKRENLTDFISKICKHAKETFNLSEAQPAFMIDAEVEPQDITFDFISDLEKLKPHGPDNPIPIFLMRHVVLPEVPRLVGRNHLKFAVEKNGTRFNGIAFAAGDYLSAFTSPGYLWDIAFIPFVNEWNGHRAVEMEIKAIAPSG